PSQKRDRTRTVRRREHGKLQLAQFELEIASLGDFEWTTILRRRKVKLTGLLVAVFLSLQRQLANALADVVLSPFSGFCVGHRADSDRSTQLPATWDARRVRRSP